MKPNLFKYATSELSQDAFICWLLEWAKPQNEVENDNLFNVGRKLIDVIFEKSKMSIPAKIESISVEKQFNGIDVLCVINNEYAIVIEDKTNTKNHSDQLKRYSKQIKYHYSAEKIILIYFKTGDQDNYQDVITNGYSLFLRNDFLEILNYGKEIGVSDSIFLDYTRHLQNIENKRNSYLTLPISKWYYDSWIGFFKTLRKELGEGDWNYVPNASGGFMGFWWYSVAIGQYEIKMQIEQGKFCFKVTVEEKSKRREIRNKMYHEIMKISKELKIDVIKPTRFGNGLYMTVAILNSDFRITDENSIINLEKTVRNIRNIEQILNEMKIKST